MGVSDVWYSCLRWEGHGSESEFRVVGSLVITIAERAN